MTTPIRTVFRFFIWGRTMYIWFPYKTPDLTKFPYNIAGLSSFKGSLYCGRRMCKSKTGRANRAVKRTASNTNSHDSLENSTQAPHAAPVIGDRSPDRIGTPTLSFRPE